jgi:hypothetical protein
VLERPAFDDIPEPYRVVIAALERFIPDDRISENDGVAARL